jgi:hypothetical protein
MPGSTRRGMAVLAFVLPAFLMLGRCTTSAVRSVPSEAAVLRIPDS